MIVGLGIQGYLLALRYLAEPSDGLTLLRLRARLACLASVSVRITSVFASSSAVGIVSVGASRSGRRRDRLGGCSRSAAGARRASAVATASRSAPRAWAPAAAAGISPVGSRRRERRRTRRCRPAPRSTPRPWCFCGVLANCRSTRQRPTVTPMIAGRKTRSAVNAANVVTSLISPPVYRPLVEQGDEPGDRAAEDAGHQAGQQPGHRQILAAIRIRVGPGVGPAVQHAPHDHADRRTTAAAPC